MNQQSLDKSVLRPVEYSPLVRLGRKGDGGYVVPEDQLDRCSILISLGLSDNWSFDRDFLSRNPDVRIIGVDHTIGRIWFLRRIVRYSWKVFYYTIVFNRTKAGKYKAKLRDAAEYFSLFGDRHIHLKKEVSNENTDSLVSFSNILDGFAEDRNVPDVFVKMDIEGAEYNVLHDIASRADRIRCMVAEFHDLDTKTGRFNECMRTLLEHFYIVHVHGNNGASYDSRNDFPSVVEISFVNRGLFDGQPAPSTCGYPRAELDFPNDPYAAEYVLSFDDAEKGSGSQ